MSPGCSAVMVAAMRARFSVMVRSEIRCTTATRSAPVTAFATGATASPVPKTRYTAARKAL